MNPVLKDIADTGPVLVPSDDVGHPAIRRPCEFLVANRGYETFGTVRYDDDPKTFRKIANRFVHNCLLPLCQTHKTPGREMRDRMADSSDLHFLALPNDVDDDRCWDHFFHF